MDSLLNLNLTLGEIQQSYSNFTRLWSDYQSFKQLGYYSQKIQSVKKQKKDFKLYYDRLWIQREMKEKELKLSGLQYVREKTLYADNVLSKAAFEKAQKQYLQEKIGFENIRTTLANTQMQINQLD